MYFCTLKIFVLSTSKSAAEEIVKLLHYDEPMEDCTYVLEAGKLGDKCEVGADSAVIIDGSCEHLLAYKKAYDERVIFLTSAEGMASADSETLSSASDIWVMPNNGEKDERLLNVYFEALLKSMKKTSDGRRAEICFNTFIDSLPDMVWFKDNDGAHLIVNDEFCGVVKKSKKQVYKKGHNYIWNLPPDDLEGEAVCRKSEEIVVEARKTCRFEEKLQTEKGMRQLTTYKSPLVDTDGVVFGTCGMGHDVTDLKNISNEFRIIMDSIPMGISVLDVEGNVIAINKFLERFFDSAKDSIGHSYEEWTNSLDKEKIRVEEEGIEYRLFIRGKERIMRFHEEPITDIFGENIGTIKFIRDITMQYNYIQQNVKYANTDFLTGLNNRRSLFEYLESLDANSMISIVMMDLDRFKSVNDTYGHDAGDEALKIASRVLEECFSDGFIARLGGDEFLVALIGDYGMPELEVRTQKFLDTLLEKYSKKEEFQLLSASAGISQEKLPVCDIQSIEDLIKRSDDALYTAKKSGKAKYCVN